MATLHKKLVYILRNHDVLSEEQNNNIYNLIRRTVGTNPIREKKGETNGVYIDLEKIDDITVIDSIYNLIKTRKEDIKM